MFFLKAFTDIKLSGHGGYVSCYFQEVFFFKGHRDLIVIATHGIIKKSQKTKKSDTEKAVRYKRKYEIAHDNKNITIINEAEE